MIITSKEQLRKALRELAEYYNHERPHQGLEGRIPEPGPELRKKETTGKIVRKQRLGGLLNVYFRDKKGLNPNAHLTETAS